MPVQPFPADFQTRQIETNGAAIHVRVGGKGRPVVLLHGYGETGDMWVPMAEDFARDHTVVVVEHDMAFVRSLGCKVTCLHEGAVLAEGSVDAVSANERVVEVYLGR